MKFRPFFVIVILVTPSGVVVADFPGKEWSQATPAEAGLDESKLIEARDYALTGNDTRYTGGFAIYDAPEPWGPWTTAFHTELWDTGPGESNSLPTRWMSDDGLTVHLVFSGEDHFSVRKGTLILK